MSKYHSRKVYADGMEFDSVKEYERWVFLRGLEGSGLIQNLQRQVPFELIPTQREPDTTGPRGGVKKGRVMEKSCSYIADFVYTQDGRQVVEDTKGVQTPEYIIKRKLMLYVHGIRIREV